MSINILRADIVLQNHSILPRNILIFLNDGMIICIGAFLKFRAKLLSANLLKNIHPLDWFWAVFIPVLGFCTISEKKFWLVFNDW